MLFSTELRQNLPLNGFLALKQYSSKGNIVGKDNKKEEKTSVLDINGGY